MRGGEAVSVPPLSFPDSFPGQDPRAGAATIVNTDSLFNQP